MAPRDQGAETSPSRLDQSIHQCTGTGTLGTGRREGVRERRERGRGEGVWERGRGGVGEGERRGGVGERERRGGEESE